MDEGDKNEEKEKTTSNNKKSQNSLMRCIIIILVIIIVACSITAIACTIIENSTDDEEEEEDDFYEEYQVYSDDELATLEKNIVTEEIGWTSCDEFVFSIENKNNETVYIDDVSVIFRDEKGNFIDKAEAVGPLFTAYAVRSSFLAIAPKTTIVLYTEPDATDSYSDFEIDVTLSETSNPWIAVENFDISAINTGSHIAVEVVNNNDYSVSCVSVDIIYYKDGEVIGTSDSYDLTTINQDESAYIIFGYPYDYEEDEDITDFDNFEVYLLSSNKEEEEDFYEEYQVYSDDELATLEKNIVTEEIGWTSCGEFVFSIENKNNETVYINDVFVIFRDEEGNFIDRTTEDCAFSLAIAPKTTIVLYTLSGDVTDSYDFEIDVAMSKTSNSDWIAVENFDISAIDTGSHIAVEVVNNNDYSVSDVTVDIIYYKDGEVIGTGCDESNTINQDESAYIIFDYPFDYEEDEDITDFDNFEVYLLYSQY